MNLRAHPPHRALKRSPFLTQKQAGTGADKCGACVGQVRDRYETGIGRHGTDAGRYETDMGHVCVDVEQLCAEVVQI